MMASYRKVQRKNIVAFDPERNYSNVLRSDGKSFCILDLDLLQGTFITLNAGDMVEVLPQQGRDRILRRVTLQALADEGYEVEPEA